MLYFPTVNLLTSGRSVELLTVSFQGILAAAIPLSLNIGLKKMCLNKEILSSFSSFILYLSVNFIVKQIIIVKSYKVEN